MEPLGTPPALGQVTVEVHGLIPGQSARTVDLHGPHGLHSRSKAVRLLRGREFRHYTGLSIIWLWSYEKMCGSFPAHGATAKAVAKRPATVTCPSLHLDVDVPHSKQWFRAVRDCCNLPGEGG